MQVLVGVSSTPFYRQAYQNNYVDIHTGHASKRQGVPIDVHIATTVFTQARR